MNKKFTVQDILNFNPCSYYSKEKIIELFKSVGCKKYITVNKLFEVNISNADFFWLILRSEFIPERQLYEISIWCAEKIALPIWEKYYPNDIRPRNAIRIKKLWLKGKATKEELQIAECAAIAASKLAAMNFMQGGNLGDRRDYDAMWAAVATVGDVTKTINAVINAAGIAVGIKIKKHIKHIIDKELNL